MLGFIAANLLVARLFGGPDPGEREELPAESEETDEQVDNICRIDSIVDFRRKVV